MSRRPKPDTQLRTERINNEQEPVANVEIDEAFHRRAHAGILRVSRKRILWQQRKHERRCRHGGSHIDAVAEGGKPEMRGDYDTDVSGHRLQHDEVPQRDESRDARGGGTGSAPVLAVGGN